MDPVRRHISADTAAGAGRKALKITLGFFVASVGYIAASSVFLRQVFFDPDQVAIWEIGKETIYISLASSILYVVIKRGLTELAEAREQLHQVIDTMPDAFFSLNKARQFTYLNKRAAAIYSRSQEDMVGVPLAQYTSVENAAILTTFLDKAIAAQKVWREQMKAPVTGVWYELTAYPRGAEVSVFLHNVSERRATEDRMRRLSLAIDNMADAFYIVDNAERFLFINKSAAEFYGKRAADIIGDLIWPYLTPHNVPAIRRLMDAARATRQAQRGQMMRGDTCYQVAIHPSEDELLISLQDVTQARQTERRLAQNVREQSALASFSVTAFQSEDAPQALHAAAELARVTLMTDFAIIAEIDKTRDEVTLVGLAGLPDTMTRAFKLSRLSPSTLVASLVREMRPLRLSDLPGDLQAAAGTLPEGLSVRSGVGAVAQAADKAVITLYTFSRETRVFTDGEGEFLQTMVTMIAALRDRRQALDTLRLRDRALEAITQGISMVEVQGKFSPTIYTNAAFAKMTGYSPTEIMNKGEETFFAEALTPDIAAEVNAAYAEKRDVHIETWVRRKDGSLFIDNMVSSPILNRDGDITHYVAVHEDLTQKRLDEALLKRKNAAQTALAEFTVASLASTKFPDLMKRACELARVILEADYATIMDVNLGDDSIQILGTAGWEVDERRSYRFNDWPQDGMIPYCCERGETVRFSDINTETRFSRDSTTDELGVRGGVIVIVSGRENVRGFLSVLSRRVREFTDDDVEFLQTLANVVGMLKERERDLARLYLRDRALDAIGQGITISDETQPDPVLIYTNPAFARMSGYGAQELAGMPYKHFLPKDFPPGLPEQLSLSRAKRRDIKFDLSLRRKDGTSFLDHVSASPIVNADGDLTNYVSIHEDITLARQRDERIHESQKLEAVGQLTGGIAHDFNNLLTVVRANAEDMRDELKDFPLLHRQADMVLQAAVRGADLVQQLMAFARKQELEPKVVDLNAMIEPFTKLVRRTLQENVHLEVIAGDNIPAIKVDPGRLENAILNLAINARDAMPEGGTITIETMTATLDHAYAAENPGVRPGLYVLLAVSDTGTGMPKEVVEKAFQPFFTTKAVGQGTGLGLSMVYGFVRQSGGYAKIYSEINHGTTVKIYLPPTDMAAESMAQPEEKAAPEPGSGNILLVEDDDLVRESVESKLLRLGYVVTPVCSAADALKALEHNPHFDLVFTDVIMPGAMTGADLTRDVMRRWPGIKVLMTSGYTEASALGKVKMPDGVRLLSKPYSNADLAQAFREVLEPAGSV